MRMWRVDPKILCTQHLLGAHCELHMFIGCIKKNTSLKGYIEKGLVEVHNIKDEHDSIVEEMKRRGMNHKTLMENLPQLWDAGCVDSEQNIKDLSSRCLKCKERIESLNAGK